LGLTAQESRVDAFMRILGVLVLIFGAAMIYLTYVNTSYLSQEAPLIPVYYMLGIILFGVGFFAIFSKYQ
jgi:hypothetical protein